MNIAELIHILEDQDIDDTVDILQNLPKRITRQVLDTMSAQNRQRLEDVLAYPENTAGGLMNTDILTLRGDITVDVALRYIRMQNDLPEPFDQIFIVGLNSQLLGVVSIRTLLTAEALCPAQKHDGGEQPLDPGHNGRLSGCPAV